MWYAGKAVATMIAAGIHTATQGPTLQQPSIARLGSAAHRGAGAADALPLLLGY